MSPHGVSELDSWLTQAGLAGKSETMLLDGFCQRALDAGLPIARAIILIDTLHPIHEGRAFSWRRQAGRAQTELIEYGPSSEGKGAENWHRSVLFHLRESGRSLFRVRFHTAETADFPTIAQMHEEGMSDVSAMITRFPRPGPPGSNRRDGCPLLLLGDKSAPWLRRCSRGRDTDLMPVLAPAVKCVSLARIAETLVETYLDRDPGRRVLKGLIHRGVEDECRIVVQRPAWFHQHNRSLGAGTDHSIAQRLRGRGDLRDSQQWRRRAEADRRRNVGGLHRRRSRATRRDDIVANNALHERVAQVNECRASDGVPITLVYLGLHKGRVLFGNIGSGDRLDFTVVCPAVNEIAASPRRVHARSILDSERAINSRCGARNEDLLRWLEAIQ